MTPKTMQRVEQLLSELDKGAVTPQELIRVAEALMRVLKDTKTTLETAAAADKRYLSAQINALIDSYEALDTRLSSSLSAETTNLSTKMERVRVDLLGRMSELMGELRAEIPTLPDLLPMTARIDDLETKLADLRSDLSKVPPAFDPKELEKDIKELEEKIKALDTKFGAVGGVSNLRIQQAFKYILKTEQPSGVIDGANTSYTVTQPIFAVLAMSLNGETIAQLPNYTIAGKTITFSAALPAAYSGKDFEIKYI